MCSGSPERPQFHRGGRARPVARPEPAGRRARARRGGGPARRPRAHGHLGGGHRRSRRRGSPQGVARRRLGARCAHGRRSGRRRDRRGRWSLTGLVDISYARPGPRWMTCPLLTVAELPQGRPEPRFGAPPQSSLPPSSPLPPPRLRWRPGRRRRYVGLRCRPAGRRHRRRGGGTGGGVLTPRTSEFLSTVGVRFAQEPSPPVGVHERGSQAARASTAWVGGLSGPSDGAAVVVVGGGAVAPVDKPAAVVGETGGGGGGLTEKSVPVVTVTCAPSAVNPFAKVTAPEIE